MKINVNSAFIIHFSASGADGTRLPLQSLDFSATVRALGDQRLFGASHRGDDWDGCAPSATDPDAVDFFIPAATLGCGDLSIYLSCDIPDESYPGGVRTVSFTKQTDITLTHGEPDSPTAAEVEAVLPFAVVGAYEAARSQGFEGSAEEFYDALAALPVLVRAGLTADVASQVRLSASVRVADEAEMERRIASGDFEPGRLYYVAEEEG